MRGDDRRLVLLPRNSNFSPEQRADIISLVLEGRRSMAEICSDHQVTSTVYPWKDQFLEAGLSGLKGNSPKKLAGDQEREQRMREIVGELVLANFAMNGLHLSTRAKTRRLACGLKNILI